MDEIRGGCTHNRFYYHTEIMSELTLQLTRKQQEMLLRGLRFVRSSVALDPIDWTEEVEADRRGRYAEIRELEEMLNGATIVDLASR